jgi:hypothetical protein
MIRMGFRSLCMAFSLSCAFAPLLTGCSNASDAHEGVGDQGSVSLALTTAGPDGATYGFPNDAYLVIQSAALTEYIPLAGSETQLSRTLAVGTYTATLYFGGGSVVLTKDDGTTTSTVSATWTNPQPVSFNIVKGQTTPLALHFSVKGLTDLVFDTGTLHVVTDVVEDETTTLGNATLSGTANANYGSNTDDTAPYASALQVDLGVDYGVSIGYHSTSAWQQSSSSVVCQNGTMAQADATGSTGLALRLAELVGADVTVCVYDYGANDQVGIYPSRFGAPPSGQVMFLPDANYYFYGGFSVPLGDVYDGTTLHQTALTNITFTNGYFYHLLYDGSGNFLSTSQGTLSGTLQFTP